MRQKLKSGQEVVVISGSHKGKRGKVIEFLRAKNRVRVEGVALMKRHLPKSQQHPEGAIVEKEGSIHYSNLMAAEKYDQSKKA
jgi:large subunit ribosomal protein L24